MILFFFANSTAHYQHYFWRNLVPEDFKNELVRMHKDGFVPVTFRDMIAGNIDIPAGKHPVVMTFDDSSPGHMRQDLAARIDGWNCGVVRKSHPERFDH